MIRLYFDWNAIVGLKVDRPAGLEALLLANKDRFRIIYSTAHIGDIFKGYTKAAGITPEITSDLEYISKLTDDNFVYYDKPTVFWDHKSPLETFQSRITTEQWAVDWLGSFLLSHPKSENSLPFTGADFITNIIKEPEAGIASFFKNLYSSDVYKDLRQSFQKALGINRDQMYNNSNPLKKINKHIASSGFPENTFDELHERLAKTHDNAPADWFYNVSNRYITLDMVGYKEDEIKIAANKTFKNTIEDAFHTAFASQCDLYITNDDRNLHKAKVVYESSGINTIVYTTDELFKLLTGYLEQEKGRSFFDLAIYKINNWKYGYYAPDNEKFVTVHFNDFFLDYFNKAFYITDDKITGCSGSWMIILTKEKPTNGRFTFINDIKYPSGEHPNCQSSKAA